MSSSRVAARWESASRAASVARRRIPVGKNASAMKTKKRKEYTPSMGAARMAIFSSRASRLTRVMARPGQNLRNRPRKMKKAALVISILVT